MGEGLKKGKNVTNTKKSGVKTVKRADQITKVMDVYVVS